MNREWVILALLPPPAKSGGQPRKTHMREMMNVILYIAGGGCLLRALLKDSPPASIARSYFWRDTGLWQTINHILVAATRELGV